MVGRITKRDKIGDRRLVGLLIEERRSQAGAARFFRVSEAAISKRAKLLGLEVPKRKTSTTIAHVDAAASETFNALDRLSQLDRVLLSELAFIRPDAQSAAERKATIDKLLGIVAEIRKTVGTYIELGRATAAITETAWFCEVVLEILNEVDPQVREAVVRRLAERRYVAGRLVGAATARLSCVPR